MARQRNSVIRGSLALAISMVATSCATDLDAVRVREGKSLPIAGAPYNLSFTQYDVVVTRRVAGCFATDETGTELPSLVIAMDAKISRKEEKDPTRHYVIDLLSLQDAWKISNIEVEYHENGTLKSLNASAEDRSAQVLSSVVTSLGKIVTASAAAAGRGASGCTVATQAHLDAIKPLEKEIKARTERLDRQTKKLETMTAIAAAMGDAWGVSERKQFANQIGAMHKERTELSDKQDELVDHLAHLSKVSKFTWPGDGSTHASTASLIPDLTEEEIIKWGGVKKPENVQAETRVFAKLEAMSPYPAPDKCNPSCADDAVRGVKYRMPAPGRLLICTTLACAGKDVVARDEGPVSQLGHVFSLPLHSPMFSKKVVVANFNNAGQPTKLGVKSEVASAEIAATAIGGMLDTALLTRGKVVTTELERVQQQTALLKAQAELAAAKKALEPPTHTDATDATAAFAADTALLNAQLANLKARAALAEAMSQVTSD